MDDSRWLRLITIGLVLAALAVGYMLFTGRFSANVSKKVTASPSSVLGQNATTPVPSASPRVVVASPSATPTTAYTAIVNRMQGSTQNLPNTGFPVEIVMFSVSGMLVGWGLRRFPR